MPWGEKGEGKYLCDTGLETEGRRQAVAPTRPLCAVVAVVDTDGVLLVAHTHWVGQKVTAEKERGREEGEDGGDGKSRG